MKSFLQKYFLIVFLAVLVVILILIKIIYGSDIKKTENNKIIPTIIVSTPMPTPFPATETDSYDPEPGYVYSIFLPYQGKKIKIEKYIKPYVLEILIKKEEDRKEAEIEFEKWLKENETYPEKTNFIINIEQ